jgi:hypothetical protein
VNYYIFLHILTPIAIYIVHFLLGHCHPHPG